MSTIAPVPATLAHVWKLALAALFYALWVRARRTMKVSTIKAM
jgi:hypothetical protein